MAEEIRLGGRYRLERRISAGGMGEVWAALDERLGRRVALKVLRANLAGDPSFRDRFRAEARAAAALSHPGVVAVYDYGEHGGAAYLAMELVDGEPLHAVVRRRGRLPPEEAMDLVAQAAAALGAAHAEGLVHRDVKPANLLVRRDGCLKVTDFGIARSVADATATDAGAVVGTVAYMSPEQLRGERVSPASDLYNLGVVAFECLTGRRPFPGDGSISVALHHLHDPVPPLPPEVPPPVAQLVLALLEKDPGRRPPSAAAVAEAAGRLAAPPAAPDTPPPPGAVVDTPPPPGAVVDATAPTDGTAPAPTLLSRAVDEAVTRRVVGPVRSLSPPPTAAPLSPPGVPLPPVVPPSPPGASRSRPPEPAPPRWSRTRSGPLGRRRHRRLAGALTVLVVLAGAALAGAALTGRPAVATVTVPRLAGHPLGTATARLRSLGLRPTTTTVDVPGTPVGLVVSQQPAGGRRVRRGERVALTVASGFVTLVPGSLDGLTEATAVAQVRRLGLTPSERTAPSAATSGEVVSFSPSGHLAEGTTVTLSIASAIVPTPQAHSDDSAIVPTSHGQSGASATVPAPPARSGASATVPAPPARSDGSATVPTPHGHSGGSAKADGDDTTGDANQPAATGPEGHGRHGH